MRCSVCSENKIEVIYNGKIRNGGLGQYTNSDVCMYRCSGCGTIWHDAMLRDDKNYYESKEYRTSLEGGAEEEDFYRLHDKETLDKLTYTGTEIFRHKIVADVGCGCGAFLDFVSGVTDTTIAIEPSMHYREIMKRKGYATYAYAGDAYKDYAAGVDIVTSFDVIEHVENPEEFLKDMYNLLKEDGISIIGTPTDAPVMRELLGEIYEKKLLFSVQHRWILTEKAMKLLADKVGFKEIKVKYFQRYGIGNMLGWIKEKEPRCDLKNKFITDTLDAVWKKECESNGLSDYIVLYARK